MTKTNQRPPTGESVARHHAAPQRLLCATL
jgi:hypothetical protein